MAKICGINHVQLAMPVGGESLARQFYGELLGLSEIPKPPNLAARGGAWFQCGPLQLHLGVEAEFRPAKKAHPALLVEGLDHFRETLKTAGYAVKFDEPLVEFERFFTADPFGNRIEFMESNSANQ